MIRPALAALTAALIACGGSRGPVEQPSLDSLDRPDAAPAVAAADAAPPDAPAATSFTVLHPAPVVALVKSGKKPALVRYTLTGGSAQVVDQSVDLSIAIAGRTTAVPTQSFGSTFEVIEDSQTHAIAVRMDRGGAADADLNDQIDRMIGAKLVAPIDDRGRLGDVLVVSEAADEATATVIAGILRGRGRPVVLPEEPIGVGGSWTVVQLEGVNGVEMEVTTTFVLTKRSDDRLEIAGTMSGTFIAQGRSKTEDRVKTMTITGSLTATIDLHRPVPAVVAEESYDALLSINGHDVKGLTKSSWRQVTRDR
jgi:hypothetical protein